MMFRLVASGEGDPETKADERFFGHLVHRKFRHNTKARSPTHEQPWHCWICSFKAHPQHKYARHFGLHLLELRDFKHPCTVPACMAVFATTDALEEHQSAHEEGEERFECKVCGEGFTMKRAVAPQKDKGSAIRLPGCTQALLEVGSQTRWDSRNSAMITGSSPNHPWFSPGVSARRLQPIQPLIYSQERLQIVCDRQEEGLSKRVGTPSVCMGCATTAW